MNSEPIIIRNGIDGLPCKGPIEAMRKAEFLLRQRLEVHEIKAEYDPADESYKVWAVLRDITPKAEAGAWIQTFTGRKFRIFDPDPADVDIRDIAHALSLLCRFGGHCSKFYSVAQHCVLGSQTFEDPMAAMHFLLHDAQEAYLCDLPRPIKALLPDYKTIEERIQKVIFEAFRIDESYQTDIEIADLRMLATEKRDLMRKGPIWTSLEGIAPFPGIINPWPPEKAEQEFHYQLSELLHEREIQ